MTSPAPMTAAALMNGCLRASQPGDQRLPGRPLRPGFLFFSAISAPFGGLIPGGPGTLGCAAVPWGAWSAASVSQLRIVGEVECLSGRLLHRDHEAHAIGAAAGEWLVGVLEGDRVHVAAALVGTDFHHPALDRGP